MNKLAYKLLLISVGLLFFLNALSQVPLDSLELNETVIVTMYNGAEYKGQLIQQDSETIVLKTVNGQLNLTATNVRMIERYDYDGEFEFPNPHDTRYFFGPTGVPLKKGEGYYQNILVTTNFVNVGVTENISIGGGFEFISTVSGSPIWFLTPKVGFNVSEKFHLGGGFIMAGFAAEGSATLGYGVVTYGSLESNLSLGVGYGLVEGSLADSPAIMLSGMHRAGNSIALLTENYLYGSNYIFGIHGVRILSKRNSFDIGALIIPEIVGDLPALPYVGYVRTF